MSVSWTEMANSLLVHMADNIFLIYMEHRILSAHDDLDTLFFLFKLGLRSNLYFKN